LKLPKPVKEYIYNKIEVLDPGLDYEVTLSNNETIRLTTVGSSSYYYWSDFHFSRKMSKDGLTFWFVLEDATKVLKFTPSPFVD
jgi:hypothetical protein